MHELPVTEDILKKCLLSAEKAGASKILQVNLRIGELAGYVEDSLQFYWDILSEATICQGSKLCIERVPAQFLCQDCHRTFTMGAELAFCPFCQSHHAMLQKGDEFLLLSIDAETEEDLSTES